ncbi:excinuclease ABC subunit C, partial [Klebsiella pneumoniae]|nr:excinuclease ABC subunit C [Klebsiella pneumoniae]
RVKVRSKPGGDREGYLRLARTKGATALTTKLSQQSTNHQPLEALACVRDVPDVKRTEGFDLSHAMGQQTVASCLVFY